MRQLHFESLKPVCPVCRAAGETQHPLKINRVLREDGEQIVEGILHCTNSECQREYPIIDGIPIIVSDLRSYLAGNLFPIFARNDLSDVMESLVGDCCGPGDIFDTLRQHLSSYTRDHYGMFDPEEPKDDPRPGSILQVLKRGIALAESELEGPMIDLGCSVGGTTFDLAKITDRPVLGVDLNFSMLRVASETLRTGLVRYPRRRVGLVYDRREFPVDFERTENVDFWACDIAALPFNDKEFASAIALNVLDSVHSPVDLLKSLDRVLNVGGRAIIACTYDWSPAATNVEAWLGGHSQRSAGQGASEIVLRSLLTSGSHPDSVRRLKIVSELDRIPWHVRLHNRSTVSFEVHLLVVEAE